MDSKVGSVYIVVNAYIDVKSNGDCMAAPARYHHGDLRAALIARAAEVVVADGVGALSLRELARDLGVSHGAPSRHFPDKQALLDALALDGFERLRVDLADGRSRRTIRWCRSGISSPIWPRPMCDSRCRTPRCWR